MKDLCAEGIQSCIRTSEYLAFSSLMVFQSRHPTFHTTVLLLEGKSVNRLCCGWVESLTMEQVLLWTPWC